MKGTHVCLSKQIGKVGEEKRSTWIVQKTLRFLRERSKKGRSGARAARERRGMGGGRKKERECLDDAFGQVGLRARGAHGQRGSAAFVAERSSYQEALQLRQGACVRASRIALERLPCPSRARRSSREERVFQRVSGYPVAPLRPSRLPPRAVAAAYRERRRMSTKWRKNAPKRAAVAAG